MNEIVTAFKKHPRVVGIYPDRYTNKVVYIVLMAGWYRKEDSESLLDVANSLETDIQIKFIAERHFSVGSTKPLWSRYAE